MPAAAEHLDPASLDPLAHHPHGLRRRHGVLVAGDEQRGTVDPRRVGGPHVGQGFARARVAFGILAHQRLADEGDSRRPLGPSFRGEVCAQHAVGDGLHVALARLGGPRPDGRARRLGRSEQGTEQGQAGNASGLGGGEMGRDDRPHGVRDDVRPLDARPLHDEADLVDEEPQRKRAITRTRAARARQVEADGAVTRQGRQQRREDIGGPAEAVDEQHGLAFALHLHGHALDEHWTPPVAAAPRHRE